MSKLLYTAAVLNKESQNKLLAALADEIPHGWRKIAHHMTVAFKTAQDSVLPGHFDADVFFGMPVEISVVGWKKDEKAIAISVVSVPNASHLKMDNAHPHITIAVAPGTSPAYSNTLMSSGGLEFFDAPIHLIGHLSKVLSDGTVSPNGGDFASETVID
jgi:hypothetical protein